MSDNQYRRRPPVRLRSAIEAQTSPPVGKGRLPDAREQPPPFGRDPFPYVIVALVGLIIIGLTVAVFLLGSITSTPQAGSLPELTNPNPLSNPPGNQGLPAITSTPPAGADSLPGVAVPSEGQNHVQEGQPITYKNYPPSSGTHYASTAEYGFSEKEIPEGKLVHDLEHGAIVLYYEPNLPIEGLASLRDAATRLPTEKHGEVKIVITPYSKLQTPLAIAAWGRIETSQQFDYEELLAFYNALVDQGPEDVP